jgi:hypothetical protein
MGTWNVLDWGTVPKGSRTTAYTCTTCGTEAALPVRGVPIAQSGSGIIFDLGAHDVPRVIRCRSCRQIFEMG